ncbi:hypothetical protein H109_07801, partial [Trichophyton interdigitale MR816]
VGEVSEEEGRLINTNKDAGREDKLEVKVNKELGSIIRVTIIRLKISYRDNGGVVIIKEPTIAIQVVTKAKERRLGLSDAKKKPFVISIDKKIIKLPKSNRSKVIILEE